MKHRSREEEEYIILNSLLSRLERTERDLADLRRQMDEDIIKSFRDTKQKDQDLDQSSTKELDELYKQLNDKLLKLQDDMKNKHNSHLEEKTILLCELQALREGNAKLIEDGLKMLQHLELLEMRIGKSKTYS